MKALRPPPSRRWLPRIGAALLVAAVAGWFLGNLGPVPDPVLEGRKASVWFNRHLRFATPPRGEDDEILYLEARRALLRLGTNAVPMLVDRALDPGSDGPIRRGLRRLGQVSEFRLVHPGSFPSPARQASEARNLLNVLRPPAAQVLPWLASRRSAPGQDPSEPLRLLAACPDAGPEVVRRVGTLPKGPPVDSRAVRALSTLRSPPPEAMAFALGTLPRVARGSLPHAELFAAFGPLAKPAQAWLESALTNPPPGNPQPRIWAAVALLEIEPDHPAASALMRSMQAEDALDGRNGFRNADAAGLCLTLSHWSHPIRSPVTRAVVEHLARKEVEGWPLHGTSTLAAGVLERLEPDRAAMLYLHQMTPTNPPPVRLTAAGALLRVQAAPEAAHRVLQEALNRYDYPAVLAAQQLGEADPGFTAAVDSLRHAATNAPTAGTRVQARTSLLRIEVRALERAAAQASR